MNPLDNKRVLITGGTGSLGRAILKRAADEDWNTEFIIFSRDETKKSLVQSEYPDYRYVLGDVAKERDLSRVMHDVNVVLHLAAYKQIPSAQVNVPATIETNIIGSQNVVDVAIRYNVDQVVATSTDKACAPANLYGASKSAMESAFQAANNYEKTKFTLTRYGNVVCSNASVIPFFIKQAQRGGPLTVTHKDMCRFWISLDEAVDLVLEALTISPGNILVPKAPAMTVYQLATMIGKSLPIKLTSIRAGEKLNECMVSEPESHHTEEFNSSFEIHPPYSGYFNPDAPFSYCTDSPETPLLSESRMHQMIHEAGFLL